MIYLTDFPSPVGSFPVPVPPPMADPRLPPYVCVRFNAAYLPYVLGALQQLVLLSTWLTDSQSALNQQLVLANDLIYLFQIGINCNEKTDTNSNGEALSDMSSLIRPYCDPATGICSLQFRCSVCDEWQNVPNMNQVAGAGQPGPGQGTPGPGQSQQYCYTVQANQPLRLPPIVNSGDVITLNSADGGWWDGNLVNTWQCPDGSTYFADNCISPAEPSQSGDPVPGSPHMSVVVAIGTNFYGLTVGASLTVPSGIISQPLTLQPNLGNLSAAAGSASICVTVQNNQSVAWTYTFDFTSNPYASYFQSDTFESPPSPWCAWIPGVGWQSQLVVQGPEYFRITVLKFTPPISINVTRVQVNFTYAQGVINPGTVYTFFISVNGTIVDSIASPTVPESPHTLIDALSATTLMSFYLLAGSANSDPGGQATITSIVVSGTGTNPFS